MRKLEQFRPVAYLVLIFGEGKLFVSLFYLHAVGESQSDQTSGYTVSLSDGKQSNEEHNESSESIRPKSEPPVNKVIVIVFNGFIQFKQ